MIISTTLDFELFSKFLAAVIIVKAVSLRDKNFEIFTVYVTLSRSSGIKSKILNGIEFVKSLKDAAKDETASFWAFQDFLRISYFSSLI